MMLAPHFSLAELVASNKAKQLKIDNTPSPEIITHLTFLAEMLERIRSNLAAPIIVTSGYHCLALNKAVGGVTSSDHTKGYAADIVAPGFGTPYMVAKALAPHINMMGVGQIALEGISGKQWVHVSTKTPYNAANRVITVTDAGAEIGIQEIT